MAHMKNLDIVLRNGGQEAVDAVNRMAADIEAMMPRWIPAGERLPEVGEHVLACWVMRKDGMATAVRRELNGKTVWSAADQWNEIDPPIAWMPLPEPPEVT